MNYLDFFNSLGVEVRQRPSLIGSGAPTYIEADIGDLYLDTDTYRLYVCTSVGDEGICSWSWINQEMDTKIDNIKGDLSDDINKKVSLYTGNGVPSSDFVGALNDLYINVDTGSFYKCTGVPTDMYVSEEYTWENIYTPTNDNDDSILKSSLFELGTAYRRSNGKLNYEPSTTCIRNIMDTTIRLEKGDIILCNEEIVKMRLLFIGTDMSCTQLVNYDDTKRETRIETTGDYVFVFAYRDDNTINSISDLLSNITITHTSIKPDNSAKGIFSIMSYNVGSWYNGSEYDVPADKYDTFYNLQKKIIERYEPDIFCAQEYRNSIGKNLLTEKYYFVQIGENAESRRYDGKAICTNRYLENGENINFTESDSTSIIRNYEKAYVYMNGRRVCVISAHLALTEAACSSNVDDLISAVSGEEYFIICMDANVDVNNKTSNVYINTLKKFSDAGYKLCNGSEEFGTFNSFASNNTAIDNIIVSSNINVKSVVMDKQKEGLSDGSDHYPLIAYLEVF